MEAIQHLSKDKKLGSIISKQEQIALEAQKNIYLYICFSIISQQLSTRVAAIIKDRFLALYKKKTPTITEIAATPFEELKSIGLSASKTQYVLNVCAFFLEHQINDAMLKKMDDEEIIQLLTGIKGVGRWTVEMILMFAMGRTDVFAVDDLGIQQQMCKLYGIDASNKKAMKAEMMQIAEAWRPYRTFACRYLWNWKDKV
jgi:DNA-3-methyladenine glycosylase II